MARVGFSVFWTKAELDDGWNEIVTFLRKKKQFSKVVKDGIALVYDLMNGNTDELLRQFPFVREAICPPEPKDDSDLDKIADKVAARLEGKLQHNAAFEIPDSRNAGFPAMKHAGQGIGKLASHTIALPVFDDDDAQDTVVVNTAAYQNTGANLIAGILGMEH